MGSQSNPNPFLDSVVILTVCALPSALVEYFLWCRSKKGGLIWRVICVHFAVVPLALVILLIPSHPYAGLQGLMAYHRRMTLPAISRELTSYIATNNAVPTASTPEQLQQALAPYIEYDLDREPAMALYVPDFGRFATGEDRRHPFEFNTAILGHAVNESEGVDQWLWYVRPPGRTHVGWELEINLNGGVVRETLDGEPFNLH